MLLIIPDYIMADGLDFSSKTKRRRIRAKVAEHLTNIHIEDEYISGIGHNALCGNFTDLVNEGVGAGELATILGSEPEEYNNGSKTEELDYNECSSFEEESDSDTKSILEEFHLRERL